MPITTAEADAYYRGDWSKWPVPEMPTLTPAQEPWAGISVPWKEAVTDWPVDTARTAALSDPAIDVDYGTGAGAPPWEGSTYGMPYQIIDAAGPATPVWDVSKPITWNWWTPTFPIQWIPLPPVVRREGDPNGSSDLHWYGIDPARKVLWEAITLTNAPTNWWRTWGQTNWCSSYNGGGTGASRWDTSKPWNAPGQPGGVVAANIPQFPLVPRWEEIVAGRITHASFGVLANYAPTITGYARASDGDWTNHPVRAGERLRLKQAVVDRFPAGSAARILATGWREYGIVHGDRSNGRGCLPTSKGGGSPITADRRWHQGDGKIAGLGTFSVRLSDFEIVTRP